MNGPAITLDIDDGIAWLTLARPEKRNSVDPEFAFRLHELAERCAAERDIRSVVLTGSGKYFRSEEHTSELQSLMRISYAVFCLKKKKQHDNNDQQPPRLPPNTRYASFTTPVNTY